MITKYFTCLVFLFITLISKAHNPLTAKVELISNDSGQAILVINTSQFGLHSAITEYYKNEDLSKLTENEYKELVIKYIKKNTQIYADNELLVLGIGALRLGNHQTDIQFFINNFPKKIPEELNLQIECFKENDNHHTIFWWTTHYFKRKAILKHQNNFQYLIYSDENGKSFDSTFIIYIITVSIFIALLFYLIKKKFIKRVF